MMSGVLIEAAAVQVEGQDYGLSTADILSLSDKELNQVVGLKKLAPYRKEANAKKSRFQTQHRLQALRQEKKVPPHPPVLCTRNG